MWSNLIKSKIKENFFYQRRLRRDGRRVSYILSMLDYLVHFGTFALDQ